VALRGWQFLPGFIAREKNNIAIDCRLDAFSSLGEARKHEPDLILLDLGLPAGDGFVVMDRLKAVPALAMIPIIVVSGRSGAANRERALKAGAKAFLEKPVDNAELLRLSGRRRGKLSNVRDLWCTTWVRYKA
jgi:CheY-like chemotaxis protein